MAALHCNGLRIGETGLEPATPGPPDQYSNHLSYSPRRTDSSAPAQGPAPPGSVVALFAMPGDNSQAHAGKTEHRPDAILEIPLVREMHEFRVVDEEHDG